MSTFDEAVERWLTYKNINQGCSAGTCQKYEGYLNRLGDYMKDIGVDYLEVEKKQLTDFSGMYLFKEKKLSARSRQAVVAALRGFFSWLHEEGIRKDNPAGALVYPKFGKPLPMSAQLIHAEKIMAQPDLATFSGLRDVCILSILIGCGLRVSGVCSLNESDLIFNQDDKGNERLFLRVTEKGKAERIVPTWHDTWFLMRAYLGHDELAHIDRDIGNGRRVLFISMQNRSVQVCDYIGEHRRIATRSVYDIVAKHGKAAGLPKEVCHPHAFRHTFGTELAEDNVDLIMRMTLMGHSQADTSAIYDHMALRRITREYDRANPLRKIKTPVTDLTKEIMK